MFCCLQNICSGCSCSWIWTYARRLWALRIFERTHIQLLSSSCISLLLFPPLYTTSAQNVFLSFPEVPHQAKSLSNYGAPNHGLLAEGEKKCRETQKHQVESLLDWETRLVSLNSCIFGLCHWNWTVYLFVYSNKDHRPSNLKIVGWITFKILLTT